MRSTINVKRGAVLAAAAIKKAVAARTAAASAAVPNGVAIPFAVFVRRLDDGFHRVAVSCNRGGAGIVDDTGYIGYGFHFNSPLRQILR